jgi:hypothetical protein
MAMTSEDVAELVRTQIAGRDSSAEWYGLVLDQCLIQPAKIEVIDRQAKDGKFVDSMASVWLILEERPREKNGYKIVFSERRGMFGLATSGFPTDRFPVLCGFYGDFPTTLESM